MKIIAFAASSSRSSINKKLVTHAASLVENAEVEVLDLNDFELPLFSEDTEQAIGKPELAQTFYDKIGSADAVVVSFAEHNGSYTAAYKNIFDWASRINYKIFQDKPAVFLSTSPGKGGAASVLASACDSAGYFAADLKASLSVPSFNDNFDTDAGEMKDGELAEKLKKAMSSLN